MTAGDSIGPTNHSEIEMKEVTTVFEGRAIGGSRAIEDRIVTIRTPLGEKRARGSQRDLGGVVATARTGGGRKAIVRGKRPAPPYSAVTICELAS